MKRILGLVISLAMCLPILATSPQAQSHSQSQIETTAAVSVVQADQGNPDVRVWVNTNSAVYHCPGTRWYGKTKQGEYMTQAEAQKKGNRPAYGKVCR
jgi:hypothetical protein